MHISKRRKKIKKLYPADTANKLAGMLRLENTIQFHGGSKPFFLLTCWNAFLPCHFPGTILLVFTVPYPM